MNRDHLYYQFHATRDRKQRKFFRDFRNEFIKKQTVKVENFRTIKKNTSVIKADIFGSVLM